MKFDSARRRNGILAIGASTGGPQAIESVLTRLPAETPPIVIAQHMPAGFTKAFAERLDKVCAIRVVEAAGGEQLEPGTAYVAPGEHHLVVQARGIKLTTALHDGPPVHHQRPAVDELFFSLAKLRGVPIVAALLTGMGSDGADGLLALRQAGGGDHCRGRAVVHRVRDAARGDCPRRSDARGDTASHADAHSRMLRAR